VNVTRFILLLLISIQISSMSFVQGGIVKILAQLPHLAEHFEEHIQIDPDLSWPEFLEMHYGDSDHKQCADRSHDALPLHSNNLSLTSVNLLVFNIAQAFTAGTHVDLTKSHHIFPNTVGCVIAVSTSVFHPPLVG
jgi:hypothetical protein